MKDPLGDKQPRRAKRTPEELAAYHREQARKNDVRYAVASNPDVRLADSIIRKLETLRLTTNDQLVSDCLDVMGVVRSRMIDETLAAGKPGVG